MWLNVADITGSERKTMSEVSSVKYQTEEVSMKSAENDDCFSGSNTINNNNYKITRNDAQVVEAERCVRSQDSDHVETQPEVKLCADEDTEKNKDENLSMLSTVSSDCPLDSSTTSERCSAGPKSGLLSFSIDRIMARNDEVSGVKRETATSEEVITSEGSPRERPQQTPEQRGPSRHWTQSELPTAAATRRPNFEGELRNQAAASWLSRLQQEATELHQLATARRHQQANLDWRSSSSLSALIGHVSPLMLYRHLQSSLASSWLEAARHISPRTSSSRSSQHTQLQPATMTMPGRLAWRTDSVRRHTPYPGPSKTTAGKLDGVGGPQNSTAADWSSRNKVPEVPKYASSGALDLSRHSNIDGHSQSTTDTPVFDTTSSKYNIQKKQSDATMWMPAVDLKNSLEKIVNEDVERPAKQISCPVCGKTFNAHYNLTRHMPVHTGARPYICKV